MRNAAYQVVGTTPGVVFLMDLDDGGRSVTNAAAEVVAEVLGAHPGCRIVYRDSMGGWDELRHEDGAFSGFAPWRGPVPVPE